MLFGSDALISKVGPGGVDQHALYIDFDGY